MTAVEFVRLDLGPLLLLVLAGIACAVPGNFLLLKRASLVGDTIAHAVLPGIVLAFLVTGRTATLPIMIGAGLAAVLAVVLVDAIVRAARIEPGAAMALVFTSFFSIGVVLLETSGARSVHIDTEHALMGAVENALWLQADSFGSLIDPNALAELPENLTRVVIVAASATLITAFAFKELRLAAFDPGFARVAGLRPGIADALLLALSAAAAVAAFEAVGAILTIALFVCPPATARLLTGRLTTQVWLSVALATIAGVLGYTLAALAPRLLGFDVAVNAGGAVALVSALGLGAAALWARRPLRSGLAWPH